MKATGEVMSIGANFESSLLKAIRSLELNFYSTEHPLFAYMSREDLISELAKKTDNRLFCICAALRKGLTIDLINEITKIDIWFLTKLKHIVDEEEAVKANGLPYLTDSKLHELKYYGFSDRALAKWCGVDELKIRELRVKAGVKPTYKMVDTCGAEFEAISPYYYSSYEIENESNPDHAKKSIVVLGSGPIRIGQGVEFDYCSVQSIWALKKLGFEAIIINNNPETVSTDFDISDKLYFEPLTSEEVWNILELEKPEGVIVQFGGQTAIKLAKSVADMGYKILGTTVEAINDAEDREEFDKLLERVGMERPRGTTVYTKEEALDVVDDLGFPVLVRPSYVLGGQGMEIAYTKDDIENYMDIILKSAKQEHPVLIDKYISGKELEVDAICDGESVLIPGIMEHIERTGVHSGDSISVYPAFSFSDAVVDKIVTMTEKLALETHTVGLINIQYILKDNELYIIEVNPRSSRTVPYISKVTDIPMVQLATRCCLGEKLKDLGYGTGLYRKSKVFAVKVPVFSNDKLGNLEIVLSPEMKSTGEVLGLSTDYNEALLKGLIASGMKANRNSGVLITVANKNKPEVVPIAIKLAELGYRLYATSGTASLLAENGLDVKVVGKLHNCDDILDLIKSREVRIIINTPTKGRHADRAGFKIRRLAVEQGANCFTSLDTVNAFVSAMSLGKIDSDLNVISLQEVDEINERI